MQGDRGDLGEKFQSPDEDSLTPKSRLDIDGPPVDPRLFQSPDEDSLTPKPGRSTA